MEYSDSPAKRLREGLAVLGHYTKDHSVSIDDYTLYYGDSHPDEISDEDIQKLDEMGWLWQEDYGCWGILL